MAQSASALEEELSCPVCLHLFRDPVSLTCQHSFCRGCLEKTWRQKPGRECPVCRRKSSLRHGVPNLKLRNIVEAYGQDKGVHRHAGRSGACEEHRVEARLFCEDCEGLVCTSCLNSEKHSQHTQHPVDEAIAMYKDKLLSQLQALHKKRDTLNQEQAASSNTAEHIRSQAQRVSRQIKAEFEMLHRFLREEERARLAALKEEEERKAMLVGKRVDQIMSQIVSLTETISGIEHMTETGDSSFLEVYKSIKERVQSIQLDPGPVSGALIDVAKHLGSLRFRIWEKMLEVVQYAPVTLDVNSAHPDLQISDSLWEVRDSRASLLLPDNAERFDSSVGVLGAEALTAGLHQWDVEVGDKTAWILGVARETISRKGAVSVSPEDGLWAVGLAKGEEYSVGTAPWGTPLTLKRKPRRIRVQLDYEKGKVSFFDPLDMMHIYTFKETFTERLFPYFSPGLNNNGKNSGPLKICPVNVSVTVGSSR
ncbi:hypothetical protein AGOR_G00115850 [Albula goreensis]|uniref:Uncharacterized protein n=1 Tax=Albula goreensis TaxID=1534307 RepID=A0A8T3DCD1_9TELE|nr:hypothetical protein AGOR_G00115850 [Albula goreensis]